MHGLQSVPQEGGQVQCRHRRQPHRVLCLLVWADPISAEFQRSIKAGSTIRQDLWILAEFSPKLAIKVVLHGPLVRVQAIMMIRVYMMLALVMPLSHFPAHDKSM